MATLTVSCADAIAYTQASVPIHLVASVRLADQPDVLAARLEFSPDTRS